MPVGTPRSRALPLGRFLPPVDVGVFAQIIQPYLGERTRVLDPFGVSPQLALELAISGIPIMIASSNPVTRFIIHHVLEPFSRTTLQAALSQIAAIPKDDTRMEHFIQDLYLSRCEQCGTEVPVEYFVWERDLKGPTVKVYECKTCGNSGEYPASEEDWDRARDYSRQGLQYALALERVAARDDPDRSSAEAALSVYPGRALFAIVTMLNKLDQMRIQEPVASAVDALLLSAFDAGNALWGHPEGRARPLQLVASQSYREYNLWSALESAVETWALPDPGIDISESVEGKAKEHALVVLYPGPVRNLIPHLAEPIGLLLTVPPRPNQAYWTLSALWAAWLWGKDAAVSIKPALRRRRYDWSWHANALKTVMAIVQPAIAEGCPMHTYIPEAEPGFVASVLTGFDAAGFRLSGSAARPGEKQAYLQWEPGVSPRVGAEDRHVRTVFRHAVEQILTMRGEPTPYSLLHTAAWAALSETEDLGKRLETDLRHPLSHLDEIFEDVISKDPSFLHLGRGVEVESGQYWLKDTSAVGPSLSDRLEALVLGILRNNSPITRLEIDRMVCSELIGLWTPDRRLVMECIDSYAQMIDEELWAIRPEDTAEARAQDVEQIRESLSLLGSMLGFEVDPGEQIRWMITPEKPAYIFEVWETTALGRLLQSDIERLPIFVVPGGRAALVAERIRRDPRLQDLMEAHTCLIKFRHVRRLAEDPTLDIENFPERLNIDPPMHQDPQLRLL